MGGHYRPVYPGRPGRLRKPYERERLEFAYISGTATAPAWTMVLAAAESWGVPPWEIAPGSKMLWYRRFVELQAIKNKHANDKRG